MAPRSLPGESVIAVRAFRVDGKPLEKCAGRILETAELFIARRMEAQNHLVMIDSAHNLPSSVINMMGHIGKKTDAVIW